MNILGSKRNEYQLQKIEEVQESENKDAPPDNQIPVPPTEDIPAPKEEPFEEDKPTDPIIDEDKNHSKLIV